MIVIKDFEMPPHCFVCPMCNANNPNRSSVALGTPFTCDITENALLDVHIIRDKDCPLVEAIPKDQYEARLKADMVAMLEEFDLEIQEQIAFMGDGEETNGMKRADNLVKDKINALKQSIWQDNYNGKKESQKR